MNPSTTIILVLAVGCAYVNGLFLSNPKRVIKEDGLKGIVILIGVFLANPLLWYLTRFNWLIGFLVWLPAIGGIAAAWLVHGMRKR
jgi:hypothetical protein